MAIVSESALSRLKQIRSQAIQSTEYRGGYEYAIRGLEAAITQLEQIKENTEGFSITLTKP